MRFLKNKILRAQQALQTKVSKQSSSLKLSEILMKSEEETTESLDSFKLNNIVHNQKYQTRSSTKSLGETPDAYSYESHKNLAVNYGKAIAKFATSKLAVPYLEELQDFQDLSIPAFQKFVTQNQSKIGGVSSLRSLLLVTEEDSREVAQYKRVFQAIGEVFIKYFSVNWILTGKLVHKLLYLKFRFRMLRNIQNPEIFTQVSDKTSQKTRKRVFEF